MNTGVWYRQPWPWVLILIPFSAVLFGIVMISATLYFPDDLVADDYYKDGMAINARLSMQAAAREQGVTARLVSPEPLIAFDVAGTRDTKILLSLYHVTDESRDLTIELYPISAHRYAATRPLPGVLSEHGIWYVELTAGSEGWRLRRRIETPVSVLEISHD